MYKKYSITIKKVRLSTSIVPHKYVEVWVQLHRLFLITKEVCYGYVLDTHLIIL